MARQSNYTDINGKPLSLNDQVAVALRRLSSGESLSIIGDTFGMNQSAVSQITWRFVEAMEERGLHHLSWPSNEAEMEAIKSKFEKIRGLPNCCGAIDITHVVMTLPTMDPSNHVVRSEKNYSMILQAVVDPEMRFRDMIVGWPGSLSDAVVLRSSGLFRLSEEGKRLSGKKLNIRGKEAKRKETKHFRRNRDKRYIIGDAAQMALARLKEMWRNTWGDVDARSEQIAENHPRLLLVAQYSYRSRGRSPGRYVAVPSS
ncbi:hypothetical protein F3Y22_tig00111877pilonHSYRG00289 [Hibiscus syriacus]|uniref:DDE Tnp4 domain-containing protein n=1 Tax=Hibiscus syriacus TaxID=106335 RepID=A0A6A2Y6N0_HIBSY|nr:hypothetical protein F3Y22_tig00111877pilonHSYRG00289 [Hibiscus syriacus]